MPQWVGALPLYTKRLRDRFWSGHITTLQVWYPVRVHLEGNFSLYLSLSFLSPTPLSLLYSLKIKIKTYPRAGIKKKKEVGKVLPPLLTSHLSSKTINPSSVPTFSTMSLLTNLMGIFSSHLRLYIQVVEKNKWY